MTRRGRGAGTLLLSLILLSCVQSAPAAAPGPPASPESLVRRSASLFARLAAYDYALAGHFAGERARVVTPERYGEALVGEVPALLALRDELTTGAFARPAQAGPLIAVADACADLAESLATFDPQEAKSFARMVDELDLAWTALRALATRLPEDAAVRDLLGRSASRAVTVERRPAFAVVTAPDGRTVASYPERATAELRAAELRRSGTAAAVVDDERLIFARSGAAPGLELWREPALDVPTAPGARRGAFVAGGFVVGHGDGATWGFDEQGRPRWYAKLAAGTSLVTPSADGRWVLVGGQSLTLFSSDGKAAGGPVRLASAASDAAWIGRPRAFVAGSPGPTGKPEGGGGTVTLLSTAGQVSDPFPLLTPAAGPALAATPARDEAYIATTSKGTTDVEALRPGLDPSLHVVARAPGEVVDLAVDADGTYGVVVTARGSFRFRVAGGDPAATLERVGEAARAARFGLDGTLYLLAATRLAVYDRSLNLRWSAQLSDGQRVLVGRRVIVQDGLRRALVFDPQSGAAEELASLGEITDLAVSLDGGWVLALFDARRAVLFALP